MKAVVLSLTVLAMLTACDPIKTSHYSYKGSIYRIDQSYDQTDLSQLKSHGWQYMAPTIEQANRMSAGEVEQYGDPLTVSQAESLEREIIREPAMGGHGFKSD